MNNLKIGYSELLTSSKVSSPVFNRATKAVINLNTYKENLLKVKETVNKKVMAIVKANAYGHGITPLSIEAEEVVDSFGVAIIEEAATLRNVGIKKPILVLGYVDSEYFAYVANENIRVTLYSYAQWKKWQEQIFKKNRLTNKPVIFHLKINTGMNRLGFKSEEEMLKTIQEIESTKGASIEGVFTHFATADEPGDSLIIEQENAFLKMISKIDKNKYIVHIANSAYALNRDSKVPFDMIRLGISSYGMLPDSKLENLLKVKTKPVLQLKTKIVHIQELEAGDRVGYGATYEAKKNERVGIIPIGYADGLLRRYALNAYVLVNGERRYFAGRVCMDQAMIKLEPEDCLEDEVVIYGEQGEEKVSLEMAAEWSNSINYELSCLISERVKRIYTK
ncbi:alanine racemase [Priestia sp. SB1]|uniref:Alanine racemase n=1 Tax=Priestia aryabhattai TaxID=412384 RepID=A0AAX6NE59_PRIAR|nr:alanine racemase [Priestia aryabhattai]MDU9694142.1 alanine racemase [Priestia aryabhattai]